MMAIEALPVSILTMSMQYDGTTINYPQVIGMMDGTVQQTINEAIFQEMQSLIEDQREKQDTDSFEEMIGTYEVKTNERHVLSLTLTNYAYKFHAANGLTLISGLTFDTATGKKYDLNELFMEGSNYVEVLSMQVKEQIAARDTPLLVDFNQINPYQDYYIADKSLILFFQEIEITPHYYGAPMFPISVFSIQDIVTEDGPLGRMAKNS